MPISHRVAARVGALTIAGALLAGLTACGSSSSPGSSATTTRGATTTSGYEVVSDSVVAAGLSSVQGILALLATDPKDGPVLAQIEPTWASFEGTIKAKAQDTYLKMEEALTNIKAAAKNRSKDAAAKARQEFSDLAKAYIAEHPA